MTPSEVFTATDKIITKDFSRAKMLF